MLPGLDLSARSKYFAEVFIGI